MNKKKGSGAGIAPEKSRMSIITLLLSMDLKEANKVLYTDQLVGIVRFREEGRKDEKVCV